MQTKYGTRQLRLLDDGETAAETEMLSAAEAALAARLRATAPEALPDPAFRDSLRAALLGRYRGGTPLRWAAMQTDVGRILLAYRGTTVVRLGIEEEDAAFVRSVTATHGAVPEAEATPPARLAEAVRRHLSGERRFTDVDLSDLPDFGRRVLEKTAEIPRGEVRPYAWIAREIGAPGAVRAVGTALGRNPIPLLIPCHRVVRSDGSPGEYSGGGPEVKLRVLSHEGVPVQFIDPAGAGRERYRGSTSTHIYCYPTCRAAQRIRPDRRATFGSPAQAMAAGYRPCKLCRPA